MARSSGFAGRRSHLAYMISHNNFGPDKLPQASSTLEIVRSMSTGSRPQLLTHYSADTFHDTC